MDREQHRDFRYATPRDLRLSGTYLTRVLITGSCLIGDLPALAPQFEVTCPTDFINFNHGCFLPDEPPVALAEYDFQIIQIPIRTIIPESRLMRLRWDDVDGYSALFHDAAAKLDFSVRNALRWNRESGLPAFVLNFLLPQQNHYGRLLPRYDIRNLVYFVEMLNKRIHETVSEHVGAYVLDADQLAAIFGRKYVQDDAVSVSIHGGLLNDYDYGHDQERLEPVERVTELYAATTHHFIRALWEEACAMFRTLRQIDAVKVVIVDLDDTLWRGVVAEGAPITSHTTEGWPLGFAESLMYLKKRGVLITIASKNDHAVIERLWNEIYAGRLDLADFAAIRCNWQPKADNIADLLAQVNLLPRNAVFIDDNPIERAAVSAAFPEMRVLGQIRMFCAGSCCGHQNCKYQP